MIHDIKDKLQIIKMNVQPMKGIKNQETKKMKTHPKVNQMQRLWVVLTKQTVNQVS